MRAYATEALRELGYRVAEASRGKAALDILDGAPHLDLLLTDVVMPGELNGRELADEAVKRRPGPARAVHDRLQPRRHHAAAAARAGRASARQALLARRAGGEGARAGWTRRSDGAGWPAIEIVARHGLAIAGDAMFPPDLTARAAALLDHCRAAGLKIATAKSCTGGLVAGLLTEIPGSSAVVERGFVVYSNEAKEHMLGVPAETIRTRGAVSEATARAMAEGALEASRADVAVSVTGVAGGHGVRSARTTARSSCAASRLRASPAGT